MCFHFSWLWGHPREWTSWVRGKVHASLYKRRPGCFPEWFPFPLPPVVHRVLVAPSSATLGLFMVSEPGACECYLVSSGPPLEPPDDDGVEHLSFLLLLALCILCLLKCLLKYFAYFFFLFFVFLLVICRAFLYVLDRSPLADSWTASIFPKHDPCLF